MGGTVAVTVKHKGVVTKMARKTGSYNWMLFSPEILANNVDKAVNDYNQKGDEFKEDFNSGEPFKYPMSGVYGWCNETAPVDYGLVYIDFDSKEIYSLQGYDSPGRMGFSSIFLKIYQKDKTEFYNDIKFINDDFVIIYDDMQEKQYSVKEFFGTDDNSEIQKMMEKKSTEPVTHLLINKFSCIPFLKEQHPFTYIQLKDWKITKYEENIDGLIAMHAELSTKMQFNQAEQDMWIEAAEYYLEDYEDDHVGKMMDDEKSDDDIDAYIEAKKHEILNKFKIAINRIKNSQNRI